MNEIKTHFHFANIVFHNDERTPLEFVVQALHLFLNKSEREAREIAGYVNRLGRFSCGVYPEMLFSGGKLNRSLLGYQEPSA